MPSDKISPKLSRTYDHMTQKADSRHLVLGDDCPCNFVSPAIWLDGAGREGGGNLRRRTARRNLALQHLCTRGSDVERLYYVLCNVEKRVNLIR